VAFLLASLALWNITGYQSLFWQQKAKKGQRKARNGEGNTQTIIARYPPTSYKYPKPRNIPPRELFI